MHASCTVLVLLTLMSPFAAAYDLSGAVVNSTGDAVPGARVWICQDRQVRHTETDAAGKFSFTGVEPKPAEVVARKEGFALGGAVTAVLGSGETTIRLGEPDVLKLRIKNPAFEPLAGAYIRHMFVADTFNVAVEDLVHDGFSAARSDEEGRLTIPELPKGSHVRFVAAHRDYADASVAYLPVGEKEQTIVLSAGVKLRGRVTAETGTGVGRACVSVLKIAAGNQRQAAETLTDPEGFYRVIVPPASYFVAVRHPNYASPKPPQVVVGENEEANVADLVLQEPEPGAHEQRGERNDPEAGEPDQRGGR